eukprot:gene13469-18067_t
MSSTSSTRNKVNNLSITNFNNKGTYMTASDSARVQSVKYTWDENNDGIVNSSDILAKFDRNQDGKLDADELTAFSAQLQSQLEYSNMLISQVHALEEEQLGLNREIQAKQDTIRSNNKAMESLNQELSEAKRKLKISQDIADNLTKQLRECRLENNQIKKDSETTMQSHLNSVQELDKLRQELNLAKNNFNNEEKLKIKAFDDIRILKSEVQSKADAIRTTTEAFAKEKNDLKSKLDNTELENSDLRNHLNGLNNSFNIISKECENLKNEKIQLERDNKILVSATDELHEKLNELTMHLEEANHRIESTYFQKNNADEERKKVNAKVAKLEEKILDYQHSQKSLLDDKHNLCAQIDFLKSELSTTTKKSKIELDKTNQTISTIQQEATSQLEEMKANYEDLLIEAQKRYAELTNSRQECEEQKNILQNQCQDLHKLVEQIQTEHQAELDQHVHGKSNAFETISKLKRNLDDSVRECELLKQKNNSDKLTYSAMEKDLKQRFAQSNEKYIESINTFQSSLIVLHKKLSSERSTNRETLNKLALFKKKNSLLHESRHNSIVEFKQELVASLRIIHTNEMKATEALESESDEIRRLKLEKEELISKNLTYEEQLSRLEHELGYENRKNGQIEKDAAAKVRKQATLNEQLVAEKEELTKQLKSSQKSLETVTNKAKELQESNQNLSNNINSLNMLLSQNKHDAEITNGQINGQLSRVMEERDEEKRKNKLNLETIAQLQLEIQKANEDLNVYMHQMDAATKDNQTALQKQQQALSTVGGATQQYHVQVKQTQELLKVTQAQRAELQAQNASLRKEVDSLYAQLQGKQQKSNGIS